MTCEPDVRPTPEGRGVLCRVPVMPGASSEGIVGRRKNGVSPDRVEALAGDEE